MSPTLIVFLIIVVWLIVLAPLLLRGQRPIRKSGAAFDDTRVLHEGGEQLPARRRQPKIKASDVRRHYDDEGDYELVEAEAEDDFNKRAADVEAEDDLLIEEPVAVVDGEVIADQRGSTAATAVVDLTDKEEGEGHPSDALLDDADLLLPDDETGEDPAEAEDVAEETAIPRVVSIDTSEAAEAARGGSYAVDETYTDPSDFLHPTARADAAAAQQHAPAADKATDTGVGDDLSDLDADADEELNEEEMAFARSRIGRGGWDPDRVAQGKADRYARRRRTLLGLGIVVVLSVILALVFGAWVWVLPALTVGMSIMYLVALRTQVRQERELHARRIRHLRRARLGVRSSGEEPRRHHMGGVVLDLEDDSPDFDFLEVASPVWSEEPQHEEPAVRRPFRRVS